MSEIRTNPVFKHFGPVRILGTLWSQVFFFEYSKCLKSGLIRFSNTLVPSGFWAPYGPKCLKT